MERFSVNGFKIEPYLGYSLTLYKGEFSIEELKFYQSDLDKYGVEKIETFRFTILVTDYNTWETLLEEEVTFTYTEPITKTALNTKLTQAKAIQKGNYTDATWNALQTAITNAQAIADNANATQAQVDAQVTALQKAIDGLRENLPGPGTNPSERGKIGGTSYDATFFNYILYLIFFGWLWMR